MGAVRRRLERSVRVLAGFVARSWRTLLVDLVVLSVWALALLAAVELAGLPPRVYHAVLLVGVLGYLLLADWWGGG